MNKIRQSFQTTAFRQGGYSLLLTTIVLGIIVIINLLAGQLPKSVQQIDISTERIYDISKTSKKLLENLDQEVTFTVFADKANTDERIRTFVEKYASLSDHIQVEWLNPVLHPSVLSEYEAEENSILVSSKKTGRSVTVPFQDIIIYDTSSYYLTGSASESEFDGEGQLTSAVQSVTSDVSKTIYYTSGHGETALPASVTDLLDKSNFQLKELNLMMASEIPEDCDLLLMSSPSTDISTEELEHLTSYLADGGNVFLLRGTASTDTPNFDAFLRTYGMESVEGYIADMERCYQGNYFYIFPEISGSAAEDLDSQMVLLTNAQGMLLTDPERDTITTTPFLTTSANGYAITEDGTSTQGTYILGASAKEKDSTVTVISADSIINESVTSQFSNIENLALFMNTMTSPFDDMDTVSIEPKSLQIENNTMRFTGILGFVFIIGIPVIFLLYGFWKWMKRKKA